MIDTSKVFVIAEAGVNHNGSLDMALQLIDAAVNAGADAVKFQTFKAEKLVNITAPKADYQAKTTDENEKQYDMLKKLELDENTHRVLVEYCQKRGIYFLSTPFDLESVRFLANELDLPMIKISSGEITNGPLLLKAGQTQKPIILSTGMSTLGEVELALGVLAFGYINYDATPSLNAFNDAYCSEVGQRVLREKVTLLHCTTEYPAPYRDVNLRVMDTLRYAFGLSVGLSDHTQGWAIPIGAVARGAKVIEKHFTLDRNLPGPDHKASLEPDELKIMVRAIRQVEDALGKTVKFAEQSERKNMNIVRKSLVAARDIKKGEVFTCKNITVKRPGDGVSPMEYWSWVGRPANKDYKQDEVIKR